jgi:hypothetical protein
MRVDIKNKFILREIVFENGKKKMHIKYLKIIFHLSPEFVK